MKPIKITKNYLLFSLFFIIITLSLFAQSKPTVVILATGGTIAGSSDLQSSNSYVAGKISVKSLVNSVPGIEKLATLQFDQVSNIPSQDMSNDKLITLANTAQRYLDKKSVSGIVITHGTDTLEETAFFLNLVLKTHKPVVITGSMRPSNALSADGPLNLYNSVAVASSNRTRNLGVLVVFNDQIFDARDCSKINTSNADAFKSYNSGPLGLVDFGTIKLYKAPLRKHTFASQFSVKDTKTLPDVAIVYEHVNGESDNLDRLLKNKNLKGIVIAGVGDGNLYKSDIKILSLARKNHIAVVLASRTGSGCVWKNSELQNDTLKFNTADTLSPQKARILLQLILLKSNAYLDIENIFNHY